ncbi:cytochrome P450 [Rhizophagus irregularis]|nr:cytochrome P450 [Rhizophagus irregularis]
MFNQPALLITDITIVQDVLINNTYDYVKPMNIISDAVAFIGRGLALSEGEDHKRQRKMMNPAFTHSNIKLISVIEDKINLGESNIILTPYISQATLDIIGLVGFNYEFNSLKSPNGLADAYKTLISPPTILHIIYSRLSYYFPFIRSIPIEINKSFINACAVIERESKNLVKRKYKEAEIGELKDDLLSVLIKLNKTLPIEEKLTDEELKYQIMTFLLAGHETTNISTNWALYLLSQHPRHMCKTYYVKN